MNDFLALESSVSMCAMCLFQALPPTAIENILAEEILLGMHSGQVTRSLMILGMST